jgi:hypothetical protein
LYPAKRNRESSRAGVDGLEIRETLRLYRESKAVSLVVKPVVWSLAGGQNTDYVTTIQAYQQHYTYRAEYQTAASD